MTCKCGMPVNQLAIYCASCGVKLKKQTRSYEEVEMIMSRVSHSEVNHSISIAIKLAILIVLAWVNGSERSPIDIMASCLQAERDIKNEKQ